jgi:hypothetical protein
VDRILDEVVQQSAARDSNSTIPVAEIEVGLAYTYYWTNTVRSVIRVGCLAQTWWGLGNSSNSSPVFGGTFGPETGANSHNDLTILGLNVMAGIEF